MTPTIQYVSKKFNLYNDIYFDGKLKRPTFKISRGKGTLGCYRYSLRNGISEISISEYYDRSEHDIDNTLIHEMIHLYQRQFDFADKGHGVIFKRECRRINQFGWELERLDHKQYEVSAKYKNKVRNGRNVSTTYNVCYYKESETKTFIFVICDSNVELYRKHFIKHNIDAKFFISDSSLYRDFPKCRNRVRGKRIDTSDLWIYLD